MKKKSLAKRMTSFILCMALVLSGLTVPAKNVQAEEVQEAYHEIPL